MESTSLEERIKFHFLKPSRGSEALFVARGHVVGGLFAFFTCFGAFEDDDVAGHRLKWFGFDLVFEGGETKPFREGFNRFVSIPHFLRGVGLSSSPKSFIIGVR